MKRIISIAILVLLCISLFSACAAPSRDQSAPGYDYSEDADYGDEQAPEQAEESAEVEKPISSTVQNVDANRKIVYSSTFEISSQEFEKDMAAISALINKHSGYVEQEVTNGTQPKTSYDEGRTSKIIARIPTTNYTKFTDELTKVGTVGNKEFNAADISDQYYDTDSRIELLQNRYDRLDEHLKKATKMEDIIKLEKEMNEVLSEMDALKGDKRGMDSKISYASCSISLLEVVDIKEMPVTEKSYSERAGSAFKGGTDALQTFFSELSLFFITISPFLLTFGAIAVVIVLIVVITKKARGKKKGNKGVKGN